MALSSKRKGWILGVVAAVGLVGVLGVARETRAFGGPGLGHPGAIMRRIASAHIDEALDQAKASPEQRQKVGEIKERLFRTLEDSRRGHRGDMDEALRLFTADQLDRGKMAQLRKARQAEMDRVGDAVEQAISDVHAVLTPAQRKVVADYVAQHRPGRER